jgi:hypothetical protein
MEPKEQEDYDVRNSYICSKLHMFYVSSNNGRHRFVKNFTALHCTSPNYTSLHFITLVDTSYLNFTQLYFTPLHCTSPNYTSLHFTTLVDTSSHLNFTQLYFTPLHYTSPNYTSLHFTTFVDTSLPLI